MFSIPGFLLGRVFGENQGITDSNTLTQLELIGGIMGTRPIGLVMTLILAQREAPPPVQTSGTTGTQTPTGAAGAPAGIPQPSAPAASSASGPGAPMTPQMASSVTSTTSGSAPQPVLIEMPDLTDLTFNESKKMLEPLGLIVARQDLYSLDVRKFHVITQSAAPKSIVQQGTTVTLFVSLGSEPPAVGAPAGPSAPAESGKKLAHAGT